MTNLIRSNFQAHPFHLVSPSPWPVYTSISLLGLTINAALSMHLFSNSYIYFYSALISVITSMTLWFKGATVRLTIELHCDHTMSLNSYLREVYLTYPDESTLSGKHSLSGKARTGSGQPLDPSPTQAVNSSEMGYSCSRDLYGQSLPMGYVQSILVRLLPGKYGEVSLWGLHLGTKLATQTVCLERSESSLELTRSLKTKLQLLIPVNHKEASNFDSFLMANESKTTRGGQRARTINSSCYLWGGGSVVLPREGRELSVDKNRLYSTKTSTAAPSWKDTKVARRLESLWKGNTKDPKFVNERIFLLLREIDLWKAAYIKLSASKGSNTPSFDQITIDGTTMNKLTWIRDQVATGQYKTGITKRIHISKANGKLRPLGIPTFYDRLVQEAVRTILQVIYEPIFSKHSHGFRPGRGCHTALRHVRKNSGGFTWAIEGDIKGFFDNINHTVLISILNKKIVDPRFISLINKLIKSKVQEEGKPVVTSLIGSGSILSPLLSNILLHEFDKFMEDQIDKFNKGKYRKANPEYSRVHHKYGAKAARKIGQSNRMDPDYRRMHYVRYADDFIITIIGSKQDALEIKLKCREFLSELNLTLKTLITNPTDKAVPFLGYLIQKTAPVVRVYYRKYHGILKRVLKSNHGSIYLKVDSEKVKKRLHEKGFCQKSGHPVPNFKYLSNTQYGTILQICYIIRGLANYYKLANNSRQMITRWNYILRFSTAMMFAAKFHLGSIAKVFSIAGKDLAKPITNVKTDKAVLGQTEEKIYDYLKSIGIPNKRPEKAAHLGIPYTHYRTIPKPDIKPLGKDFKPRSIRKDISPLETGWWVEQ